MDFGAHGDEARIGVGGIFDDGDGAGQHFVTARHCDFKTRGFGGGGFGGVGDEVLWHAHGDIDGVKADERCDEAVAGFEPSAGAGVELADAAKGGAKRKARGVFAWLMECPRS